MFDSYIFLGHFHTSTDFVFTCGGLTSCAFLDKKGLLSWPNATVEKVLCFHSDREGVDYTNFLEFSFCSFITFCIILCSLIIAFYVFEVFITIFFKGEGRKVVPKILDLTMNEAESFPIHFDDSSWLVAYYH